MFTHNSEGFRPSNQEESGWWCVQEFEMCVGIELRYKNRTLDIKTSGWQVARSQ